MGVTVHGEPGASISEAGGKYKADARRGAFGEQVVARAAEHWLAGRADETHLFHDLTGLEKVTGGGMKALGMGAGNIDHVVLGGERWLLFDAKFCAAGTLTVDDRGRGVLVKADGTVRSQRWLDDRRSYSRAGLVYRLTGGVKGLLVWILPGATIIDPAVAAAACFREGGVVLSVGELAAGDLDDSFPLPQSPADPRIVERLCSHLSVPGTRRGERAAEGTYRSPGMVSDSSDSGRL